MPWLRRKKAMEALGVTPGKFSWLVRKQKVLKRGEVGYQEYWCPDESDKGPSDSPIGSEDKERREEEKYIHAFDPDGSDRYIIRIQSLARDVIFDGAKIRSMWRAYATGRTVDEVCRQFNLARPTFINIRDALGLTHTSAPWPPEVVANTDESELVHDAVAAKTQRVYLEAERKHWRQIAKAGKLWMTGPGAVLDEYEQRGHDMAPPALPPVPKAEAEHVAVLGCTDLHVGKRPFKGDDTPKAQRERLALLASQAIGEALEWGPPRKWYVHLGGDLLQADNAAYTTTRGTPQGGQHCGSIVQAWEASLMLMAAVVEEAAKTAPVQVVVIPGNHDWVLSITVGGALRERYRHIDGIDVDVDESPRRCYIEDGVPIMFDHGHRVKPRDYPAILAREMPQGSKIARGVVFRGHFHAQAMLEVVGVDVVTMPSASVVDDWHYEGGYLSRPRMGVYKITRRGLVGSAVVGLEHGEGEDGEKAT